MNAVPVNSGQLLSGFARNELVAEYRMRVGRRIGSAALVADGLTPAPTGSPSLAVVAGALAVLVGWRTRSWGC